MFKLTRPCSNCPFKKGVGERFGLHPARVAEIAKGAAFQCHKTVDYDEWDDPHKRSGEHPQQCAGLMSLLHRSGEPNQIMQVGERLKAFDPSKLDHSEVYDSLDDAIQAHRSAW